jgi:hypothetical protein
MPTETPTAALTEEDYESIESAVMETARGRWFLAEYARRIRAGDTDRVLASIARLEAAIVWRGPAPSPIAEVEADFSNDPTIAIAEPPAMVEAPPKPLPSAIGAPPTDPRLAALAHLDALTLAEKFDLFV